MMAGQTVWNRGGMGNRTDLGLVLRLMTCFTMRYTNGVVYNVLHIGLFSD